MKKAKKFLLFVLPLIIGFIFGFIFSEQLKNSFVKKASSESTRLEKRESGFTFINPLLECEYVNNQGNLSLKNIKNKI